MAKIRIRRYGKLPPRTEPGEPAQALPRKDIELETKYISVADFYTRTLLDGIKLRPLIGAYPEAKTRPKRQRRKSWSQYFEDALAYRQADDDECNCYCHEEDDW
jgi:hypothetical protein